MYIKDLCPKQLNKIKAFWGRPTFVTLKFKDLQSTNRKIFSHISISYYLLISQTIIIVS